MTPILHIDFETRSAVDLKEVGLWNYARHPTTDVWCMAYALGDNEPSLWVPGNPLSIEALDHVSACGHVYAHNAAFELAIWNSIMVPRYGWPELKPEQTFCTMAMAYAMGLPGGLDNAAAAMGIPARKDTDGHALMMRMCRPRSKAGVTPVVWWDEPEKLNRLYEYCKQDVRVERELHRRLLPLSPQERKVWLLDYEINQRGVAVDVESAKAATKMADIVKEKCNAELAAVTGGIVAKVSAVAAFKEWLGAQGVETDSLDKQTTIDLLDGDLPAGARRAIELRQEASKASTAKFDVMVRQADENGRLRNLYQYHGAGTGRWAGRAIQAHNLPRDIPGVEAVESILEYVHKGNHDAVDAIYGPPLSVLSRCLRAFFVAAPGSVLVSGDFSNIEGRGQAWFAGEQWKLDAFRAADERRGPGLYELAYSRMFNVPVTSVKNPSEERQIGKVAELAFGYQGGAGSFHKMGKVYNVKVSDQKAEEFKAAWRQAHPKIKQVWFDIERAAVRAVQNPGTAHSCGAAGREAKFKVVGSFLWLLLPSGRAICYPYPKLLEGMYGPQVTYMTAPGQDKSKVVDDPQNSSSWVRVAAYGGSLFNNIVQGFCRDFLAECMLALDDKGAKIVLHTHDEVVIEVDEAKGASAQKGMQAIMRSPPAWATGFPLYVDCEVSRRYGT